MNWNTDSIPDLHGRIAIVTGATSGLGKETARVLAGKGAQVVMAVRNTQKGDAVADEIRRQFPHAAIEVSALDLASLASVRRFSDAFAAGHARLDLLVNNAGIMMCPFDRTEDGFEIQMGTNHLGHFALTGYLLPLLRQTPGARIVATSSVAHRRGNIDLGDIGWEKRKYDTVQAYGDSKIANLYFAYAFARKFAADPSAPLITAAHPGWTRTELQRHSGVFMFLNRFFAQDADMGALPTLRAAFDPAARSGDYYGPSGWMELQGYPVKVASNKRSHDADAAARLWQLSETLTGVAY
ncbi:MAG: SDR family NAD(P)-dependent oxidoreductase [Bacteroidia bacterium]